MDITQHLAVLSRWRKVILASLFLGVILAALFTIKFPPKDGKIDWRRPEKWESTSRILVTQSGFPWGRTTLPGGGTATDLAAPLTGKKAAVDPNAPYYADPSRLSLLAIIYSFISQSNTVGGIGGKPLPAGGTVTALPISNQQAGALPIIELATTGYSKAAASALNVERSNALSAYLARQQDANDVPAGQRVKLAVLNKPEAKMIASHGMALGFALVFLAVAAGIAASYVLESLRMSRQEAADRAVAESGELVEHPTLGGSPSLSDAPKRNLR
ncbi:MAG TPA: hypothetical protein VNT03_03525 [Baekduia sp.]|nr:hypothetical protein [Baekduia sp.]